MNARTINTKRASKRQLELVAVEYAPEIEAAGRARPRRVADCPRTQTEMVFEGERIALRRPDGSIVCPWASCKHHNYLDVSDRTGSIKLNFPDRDPTDLTAPCALEVADRRPAHNLGHTEGPSQETVADAMNLCHGRIGQLERKVFDKLQRCVPPEGLGAEIVEPWQWAAGGGGSWK